MSKTKKILTLVAAFILVIVMSVAATLAFLADETQVAKNTFTVGHVNIKLDEAVVDEDGKATDERTEEGNTDNYDGEYGYGLVPGKTVDKDPTVTVLAGSEECYVRLKVTLDNVSKFVEIFRKHNEDFSGTDVAAAVELMKEYFVDYDSTVWEIVDSKLDGDKLTVTFNYVKTDTVAKSTEDTELDPIITALTLPEWVDSDDAAALPNFSVEIVAQAIQAAGFEDAEEAWAAFDEQMAG